MRSEAAPSSTWTLSHSVQLRPSADPAKWFFVFKNGELGLCEGGLVCLLPFLNGDWSTEEIARELEKIHGSLFSIKNVLSALTVMKQRDWVECETKI